MLKNDGCGMTIFRVSGCQYEGRPSLIRMMPVGARLVLVDDPKTKGVSLLFHGKQIGWIPNEMIESVRRLRITEARAMKVGTDPDGSWTRVVAVLKYPKDDCTDDEAAHGLFVAGILKKMRSSSKKSVEFAKVLCDMSPTERLMALQSWDDSHMDAPRRRRRKKNSEDQVEGNDQLGDAGSDFAS